MVHRHFPRQSGFTLLELLAGIALLAVLVALTVGGIKTLAATASKTRCTAHLGQISQALLLYAQDHNQELPAAEAPFEREGMWFAYRELVTPYLHTSSSDRSSAALFSCPADKNFAPDKPSYFFSGANQHQENFHGLAGVRLPAIAKPAQTILVAEGAAFFPFSWHAPHPGKEGAYSHAQNVAAFADGHVSFLEFYSDGSNPSVASDPPPGYAYKWSSD